MRYSALLLPRIVWRFATGPVFWVSQRWGEALEKQGRMTTFYIEQFGCRATQADGAALERQLRERGCALVAERAAADVVVINTCTVTAAADAQARDSIRKIHAANPGARVIVTGCYAQRAPEEIAALPGVAWVVGNSHKAQIPELIGSRFSEGSFPVGIGFVPVGELCSSDVQDPHSSKTAGENIRVTRNNSDTSVAGSAPSERSNILVGDVSERSKFLFAPVLGGEANHTRPTVKIQDGCNSRCSYCVIPFVRGRGRSLPPELVVEQIRQLATDAPDDRPADLNSWPAFDRWTDRNVCPTGAREIVLSGINLGTYGRDLSPRVDLIDLLRRILDETSIERLRISSIEPMDVTQDLIGLFASTERIAQHFHMPLQSGSDRMLAAMRRWYRAEHYARRVELIREQLPDAAIGADVIAGFPGESQVDHEDTCTFLERLPFTYLHVFSFSSRPGTHAASLPNHVPSSVVKQRARDLRALGEAKAAGFRRTQIGRTLRVLTLRRDEENIGSDFTPALSSNFVRVSVPGSHPANSWLDATIESQHGNGVSASLRSQR
jgi:threonylcarbamoyladenosine tRNA methylthiotransferase MtaB